MTSRSPSTAETIKAYVENELAELRVCLPATVESFDAENQTVDVQPSIRRRLQAADGTVSYERLPVIRSVPVLYPRGGGFYFYMPLAKGDRVILHFADFSLDAWWDSGRESSPDFAHFHDMTDCFAVPAGYPRPESISGVSTSDAVIGKEGGAVLVLKGSGTIEAKADTNALVEAVALAEKTLSRFSTINTWLGTHTHSGVTTGPGTSGTPASPPWPTGVPSVASDTLKASG